jgi:hypothetical protein
LLGWDFNPERFHWDLESWVQSLEVRDRLDDPFAALIDFLSIFVVQSFKHIQVPLTEFMNPSWDQMRAIGVADDRVKTTLKRERS